MAVTKAITEIYPLKYVMFKITFNVRAEFKCAKQYKTAKDRCAIDKTHYLSNRTD